MKSQSTHKVPEQLLNRSEDVDFNWSMWREVFAGDIFHPIWSWTPESDVQVFRRVLANIQTVAEQTKDLGFTFTLVAHGLATLQIAKYGSVDQKGKYLKAMVQGKRLGAICNSEPGSGTDIRAIKSKVVTTVAGFINLEIYKSIATNLPMAEILLCSVRTDDAERSGIRIGVIDTQEHRNLKMTKIDTVGLHGGSNGSLDFVGENLIASDFFLGPVNGVRLFKECFNSERLLVSAAVCGVISGLIAPALAELSAAKSFGQSLTEFQYMQGKIVSIYTSREMISSMIYRAIHDLVVGQDIMSIPEERLASLKLVTNEQAQKVAEVFSEIFGARGYASQHLAARTSQDFASLKALGGTKELQKILIFNQLIKHFRESQSPGKQADASNSDRKAS